MSVQYIVHMSTDLAQWYRETLRGLNLVEVSRETGRGLRTLQSYMSGERRVTKPAAEELVAYLRSRSSTFLAAADRVEAALKEEGEDG